MKRDEIGVSQDTDVHVYPLFGPEHEMNDRCWCHPVRDLNDPSVVLHNVAH